MPERIFRVVIQNLTTSLTLRLQTSHLCGGDWTPGGWTPPATIGPGESGGIQSESGGVMTGTEGYAKYEVDGPGKRGVAYVYWSNPYHGVTHFRNEGVALDIEPDCDFDPPSPPSTFEKENLSFSFDAVALGHTNSGTDITSAGDLLSLFFGPTNIPVIAFLGLSRIIDDPVLYLSLNDHDRSLPPPTPPPLFGDLGPKSWKPLTDAGPEQWVGHWGSGRVALNIADTQAEPPLLATVSDWTAAPPLSMSETFTPGAEGLLVGAAPLINAVCSSRTRSLAATNVCAGGAFGPLARFRNTDVPRNRSDHVYSNAWSHCAEYSDVGGVG